MMRPPSDRILKWLNRDFKLEKGAPEDVVEEFKLYLEEYRKEREVKLPK